MVGGSLSRVCGGKLGSLGGLGMDPDWSVLGERVGGFEVVGAVESGGK